MALNTAVRHDKSLPGRNKKKTRCRVKKLKPIWILLGEIGAGKRRANDTDRFSIVLDVNSASHARKSAHDKLQAIAIEKMKSLQGSNISLAGVFLKNGRHAFRLKPQYCNKKILFVKNPRYLWQGISVDKIPAA